MELLTSLTDYSMGTPFSESEVIKLGIHICRALELCAKKNIIHRDIKPDNIFVSPFHEYKLGDFGIARHIERTMSGLSKKGTFTYMAPEVFRGEPYSASVDIYSLGMVMYSLLNQNRAPFLPEPPHPITPGERDTALQRRMSGEPLPFLKGVSQELNTHIIQRACVYNRNERFADPTQMRQDLEQIEKNRDAMQTTLLHNNQ
jgi:serine/threonine-protein kinase